MREYVKRWPPLYYFIVDFFGPIYLGGLTPTAFLKRFALQGTRLSVGSGARKINSLVTNVDMTAYPGVDIVADMSAIPLPDDSVSMIMCENALEHVGDPRRAVAEMHRLLKAGGLLYVSVPFLYPFHSSPSDYERWSPVGLRELLRQFTIVEEGVRSGPFSVINVFLVYFFASILSFGVRSIYDFLLDALIFIFFPIKYLDVIANHLPFAQEFASVLYIVVRKS